jgi:hypothetical protein
MHAVAALLAALVAGVAPAAGGAATDEPEFLTGPAAGKPLELALGYLVAHHPDFGLEIADVGDLVATKIYTSRHTGVTHLYLQQRYGGSRCS